MWQFERKHSDFAESKLSFHHIRARIHITRDPKSRLKGEREHLSQLAKRRSRSVQRERPIGLAKRTQIVEAEHMVGVGVRVECGVHPSDSLPKTLGPKVSPGIHHPT
jgi:hypothetical protein